MDIRLLGPVELGDVERSAPLGGAKQRAVLAMLALRPNETVGVDRLAEGLWGDDLPDSAAKMVQLHVSRLRRVLDDDAAIITRGRGYELRIEPERVDVGRARALLAAGEPRRALALWRGPPLADVSDEPFAAVEARRLEELRLAALETAVEADLAAGRHRELVAELESLVADHPVSERLHAQRMLALYRSNRQADALEAYREARRALVEAAGVEPGPDLRRLHEAVLAQDPALDELGSTELAAALARETARREVATAAGRAAAGRRELAVQQRVVAGSVLALRAAQTGAVHDGELVCPYKGLATFGADDAAFYRGRDRLVAELVARLVGAPMLLIVGPSGSGKSSVLRAGLLPALAGGVLPGSDRWALALMRPGADPLRALEQANGRLGDRRGVLAVDQFEECFQASDSGRLATFLDLLAAVAGERVSVVLAVRADGLGRLAEHAALTDLAAGNDVLVGPPTRTELVQAIVEPAEQAGLDIEPGLAERLADDVSGEPGALPLLSSALLELWQVRDGRTLRLADYERAGGVRGAVARLGEAAYGRLTAEDQATARVVLERLAGHGDDGGAVRRRVPLAELGADRQPAVRRALSALADRRLVSVGDGHAEIAHEALLREWPRLRDWLDEDADGRRVHRHLTEAAAAWEAGGRDGADLYRGARLGSALAWVARRPETASALERAFLDASRAAAEAAEARALHDNRRLRGLLLGVSVLLVLAAVAGLVALHQRSTARTAARAADAQRLGATALVDARLDRALLEAREGSALDEGVRTRGYLLAALLRSPAALAVFHDGGERILAVKLSPDGRTLYVAGNGGRLERLNPRTRAVRASAELGGAIGALAVSRDGRMLAVGHSGANGDRLELRDARTLRVVRRLRWPSAFEALLAAFSPDGTTVYGGGPGVGGAPGTALGVWDTRSGAAVVPARRRLPGVGSTLQALRDGTVFAGGDGGSRLLARRTLVERRRLPGGFTVALSSDARTLALGGQDGAVRFVDVATGETHRGTGRHDGAVQSIGFTPDGRHAITTGDDSKVLVWDTRRAAAVKTYAGHAGRVLAQAVSPDGDILYTGSLDHSVIAWDLSGRRGLERRLVTGRLNPGRPFFALSPDGRTMAVPQLDGTVHLIDPVRGGPPVVLDAVPEGRAVGVAIAPDGRTLAVTGDDGYGAVFDLLSRRRLWQLPGLGGTGFTPSFDASGRRLAILGTDQRLHLFDLAARRPLRPAQPVRNPNDVGLSPDGRLVAIAHDAVAEVLDTQTGRRVARVPADSVAASFARFSPSGRLLAVGGADGDGRVYRVSDWKPLGRPLSGLAGYVMTMAFSPDERTVLMSGTDGAVRLYDVATSEPVGSALPATANVPVAAAFLPDGRVLAGAHDGTAGVWDVRLPAMAERACAIAGRDLTRSEWADLLPDRTYARTCSSTS